ncbi:MAG: NUDIX hydrolase [Pseudonocardia sp.]
MTERDVSIPCVGALTYAADGRLLLVQRANDPGRGLWSLPGGRVEPGEDELAALVREMAEETGLVVAPGALVGRVRRESYEIADYRCAVVGGALRAGDDALDVRWCDAAELAELPLVEHLLETLTTWDALPRPCADNAVQATVSAHDPRRPRSGGSNLVGGPGPAWDPEHG